MLDLHRPVRETARTAALMGLLGALLFASKMAMAQLPNLEPVSLLVMLYGAVFGRRALWALYVYVILEWILWGAGLWAACYLYVWLPLFALARLLRRMESPLGWAVLSGCFGLLFGALCAPVYWAAGGWAAALSWWLAGIPMDLLHGAGNFCLALTVFRPLRQALEALARRYSFTGS